MCSHLEGNHAAVAIYALNALMASGSDPRELILNMNTMLFSLHSSSLPSDQPMKFVVAKCIE